MERMLVISDIHGELEKFEGLLEVAGYDPAKDQLILLGDYVDRGPNAKGVIDKVIALKEAGALVLKGNHEDLMIKALMTEDERAWKRWAQMNGGDMTLRSYGFTEADFAVDEQAETFIKPTLQSEILTQHLAFITNLEHYMETDEYVFVHAGVQPGTPVSETDPHTLMWIRDEFHTGYSGKKIVIFGHTSTDTLYGDSDNFHVYFGVNRIIGIDGGAVYGGQLNCLELPSQAVYLFK